MLTLLKPRCRFSVLTGGRTVKKHLGRAQGRTDKLNINKRKTNAMKLESQGLCLTCKRYFTGPQIKATYFEAGTNTSMTLQNSVMACTNDSMRDRFVIVFML